MPHMRQTSYRLGVFTTVPDPEILGALLWSRTTIHHFIDDTMDGTRHWLQHRQKTCRMLQLVAARGPSEH